MDKNIDKNGPLHSFVNVKERKAISLDGIKNVVRFDEGGVTLLSNSGRIEIEGGELKIVSLSKEDGVIIIEGRIDGVFYEKERARVGFFKSLFG